MQLIFMGTPGFAVPSLQKISTSSHEICGVVTGRDVPRGRGQQVKQTPVKRLAKSLGFPLLQPRSLRSEEFIEQIRILRPDILVVVAFRILPDELLRIPPFGAINLHASLLPKYRGAAPINWALINGERETGVTIFQIRTKVDTGDILAQERVAIAPNDTYADLSERLAIKGAELIVRVLDAIEKGTAAPRPQSHELATHAPKITPEMGLIDWSKKAPEIRNLIHGLSPNPGAFSLFGKARIKFLRAAVTELPSDREPGTIVLRDKHRLGIQTGEGILLPLELQREGKRPLNIETFMPGFQGQIGDVFHS